jgi:hypothetical protein
MHLTKPTPSPPRGHDDEITRVARGCEIEGRLSIKIPHDPVEQFRRHAEQMRSWGEWNLIQAKDVEV